MPSQKLGVDGSSYSDSFLGGAPVTPFIKLKDGTGPALFLVHPAGGTSICYRQLAAHLYNPRPVYGLEAQHEVGSSIEAAAAAHMHTIRDVQPNGPYLLGGWSLGGVIAFEVCRQLERSGEQVELIFLFDAPAPAHREARSQIEALAGDSARALAMAIGDLERLTGENSTLGYDEVAAVQVSERVSYLVDRITGNGTALAGLGHSFLDRFLRSYIEAPRLLAAYEGGPCSTPVVLIQALEPSSDATERTIDAQQRNNRASIDAWRTVCQGPLRSMPVPGSHEDLMSAPHVQVIAEQIDHVVRLGSGFFTATAPFDGFTTDMWRALLAVMSPRPFIEGEHLIEEGETARQLLLVTEGFLNVYAGKRGPDDPIRRIGPGSIIGEIAFIDGGARTLSVQAQTDGLAYALAAEDFERLANVKPEIALRVMREVSAVLAARHRGMAVTYRSARA